MLFQNDYFSYEENAIAYVEHIVNAIEENIPERNHKLTPESLIAHGEYYVKYSATKRTTWYIFFSQKGNRCLIKCITNNHVADAAFLQHF